MTQSVARREDRKNNKLIIAIVLIVAAVGIITGLVFAFFSDVITGEGSATSGTLDLRGEFNYQINADGTDIPMDTDIDNLNPGDAVYIHADVTNAGNKSAWVRGALLDADIDADLAPYIFVFSGNVSQSTLRTIEDGAITDQDKANALCNANGYVVGGNGGLCDLFAGGGSEYIGIGTLGVLNGTGTGAEVETPSGVDSFSVGLTVYFAFFAPNTAQGKPLNIVARAEGLQYRNNPGITIDSTAWGSAESTTGINDTN